MILTKFVTYRGKKKRIEDLPKNNNYKVVVECPNCGEVREVYHKSIIKAGHTFCHSCVMKEKFEKTLKIGSIYNRLTVIKPSTKSGYSICRCECGNETEVWNPNLKRGTTKSCGCLRSENMKENGYNPQGEEHWNWQGGKTDKRRIAMSRKDYQDWRKSVFERDNYTCVRCEQWGGELRAHHIMSFSKYPKLRTDLDNGVTLCDNCHREFHRINGFDTNNEQLNKFIK